MVNEQLAFDYTFFPNIAFMTFLNPHILPLMKAGSICVLQIGFPVISSGKGL